MTSRRNIREMIYLGLMIGIAISLNIFESIIPIPTPVPGAKLGLANIAALFVIVQFGPREAVIVSVIRTFLGSLFSGTLFAPTFFLSFFGGLMSTLVMGLAYRLFKKHFSIIGISILGSITHNLTQLTVASVMFSNIGFFYLLPYLLFFALPTGFFVGIVTNLMIKHSTFN